MQWIYDTLASRAGLGGCSRSVRVALSKDYEALPENSEVFIYLATIHLILMRLI